MCSFKSQFLVSYCCHWYLHFQTPIRSLSCIASTIFSTYKWEYVYSLAPSQSQSFATSRLTLKSAVIINMLPTKHAHRSSNTGNLLAHGESWL